jgi:hypothetical protein
MATRYWWRSAVRLAVMAPVYEDLCPWKTPALSDRQLETKKYSGEDEIVLDLLSCHTRLPFFRGGERRHLTPQANPDYS